MKKIYILGISGTFMSGLAIIAKEAGFDVSGCDANCYPPVSDLLKAKGISWQEGYEVNEAFLQADEIVVGNAMKRGMPIVEAMLSSKKPYISGPQWLYENVLRRYQVIAISGTHGKTTTTSMIAHVLDEAGLKPGFLIGGVAPNFQTNARLGAGRHFVIEADEYDRMFLGLKPHIEVVTNLEHDHPDCYPTFDDMYSAFQSYVDLLPQDGSLIVCAEDDGAVSLLSYARRKGLNVSSYSLQGELTINSPQWMQARAVKPNSRGGYDFSVVTNVGDGIASANVSLQVPGEHNVRNALATLSVMATLGLPLQEAADALGEFTGTGRRFEVRGETKGVTVIDDYAHHPSEIKATLKAAKQVGANRIITVFQPHRYSRTSLLREEFGSAFLDSDVVIINEIYGAGEKPIEGVNAGIIVDAMERNGQEDVVYLGSREEIVDYLAGFARPGDLILTMGAGNIWTAGMELVKRLQSTGGDLNA